GSRKTSGSGPRPPGRERSECSYDSVKQGASPGPSARPGSFATGARRTPCVPPLPPPPCCGVDGAARRTGRASPTALVLGAFVVAARPVLGVDAVVLFAVRQDVVHQIREPRAGPLVGHLPKLVFVAKQRPYVGRRLRLLPGLGLRAGVGVL